MKKSMLGILILSAFMAANSQAALLTLVANGVDGDGMWAQSIIDIDSVDDKGIFILSLRGDGGPSVQSDGSVEITSIYFGSESDTYGLRDSARGFGLWIEPFFYMFISNVTDFHLIGMGVGYVARFIVLRLDYNTGTLILDKIYMSLYLSDIHMLCNDWHELIPQMRFEYLAQ